MFYALTTKRGFALFFKRIFTFHLRLVLGTATKT